MKAPKTKTVTTETHDLTHDDIVGALRALVLARSRLSASLDQISIHISPDTSWESEGQNKYEATAKVVVNL